MKVIISGGSGLIGTTLTTLLRSTGHDVLILTRNRAIVDKSSDHIYWNPAEGTLNPKDLEGSDAIIHLAGAGIADKRWSVSRKKEIVDSRVQSSELLVDSLNKMQGSIKHFISASGTGFYGSGLSDELKKESDDSGNDFLSACCVQWENSASQAAKLGAKVTILRTGVVLAKEGGALPKLALPVKLFAGAPLGTGKQYFPWIHIKDLCAIYVHCLENGIEGIFNAVAPESINNKEFTKSVGKVLGRPVFLPPIPGFLLKMILGELASTVIYGQNVSAEKIIEKGFKFEFLDSTSALKDLL